MKTSDIVIDVIKTIGKAPYLACSCDPIYEYDEHNNKTDNVIGHKVEILLPQMKYAKFGVKVDNTINPLPTIDDVVEVDFTNLMIGIYVDRAGRIQPYGKADNVHVADKQNIKMNVKAD